MITGHELRRVVLSLPEAEERETWGVPAHVGRHGWMSIRLVTVDPTELGELGGRGVAPDRPRRLVAAYDADQDPREPGSDAPGSGG
jgi:hypothetical protein